MKSARKMNPRVRKVGCRALSVKHMALLADIFG